MHSAEENFYSTIFVTHQALTCAPKTYLNREVISGLVAIWEYLFGGIMVGLVNPQVAADQEEAIYVAMGLRGSYRGSQDGY
jgi:hypothetical protein